MSMFTDENSVVRRLRLIVDGIPDSLYSFDDLKVLVSSKGVVDEIILVSEGLSDSYESIVVSRNSVRREVCDMGGCIVDDEYYGGDVEEMFRTLSNYVIDFVLPDITYNVMVKRNMRSLNLI